MYKIIACDLDETLLSDDRSISKENIEAIQKAKELGVKFVPATGRGYNTVDGTLKELGLYDLENEYVISYNGGAISENKGSKLLHFEGITFEKASELYKRGLNYDVCIHVYTKDMVYAYKFVQEEINYLAGRMEVKEIFDDHIDFLKGQEIVKVLYMNTDYDYLKKIEDDLKDITGDLDVSYSSNRYIEFNHQGVNKGQGLKKLADILSNYQGYRKCTLILVYDAYKVEGNPGEVMKYHNIYIVYTKEAETADQYIEKTVRRIAKDAAVTVATSDGLEQVIILGQGANRMSAPGLKEEIERTLAEVRGEHLGKKGSVGNYLFDYLDEETAEEMEKVRLGKAGKNGRDKK